MGSSTKRKFLKLCIRFWGSHLRVHTKLRIMQLRVELPVDLVYDLLTNQLCTIIAFAFISEFECANCK